MSISHVTMFGISESRQDGVRDQASVLADALGARGIRVEWIWEERDGTSLTSTLNAHRRLLQALRSAPSATTVLWHYTPVGFGYRGIPGPAFLVPFIARTRSHRLILVAHELASPFTRHANRQAGDGLLIPALHRFAAAWLIATVRTQVVTTTGRARTLRMLTPWRDHTVWNIPVTSNFSVTAHHTIRANLERIGVLGWMNTDPSITATGIAAFAERTPANVSVTFIGSRAPSAKLEHRWRGLLGRATAKFAPDLSPTEFSTLLSDQDVVFLPNAGSLTTRSSLLAVALSHGLPIVGFDSPDAWSPLRDVVILADNDSESVVAGLSSLIDPAVRSESARRARNLYEAHLSPDHICERFLEVFSV